MKHTLIVDLSHILLESEDVVTVSPPLPAGTIITAARWPSMNIVEIDFTTPELEAQ